MMMNLRRTVNPDVLSVLAADRADVAGEVLRLREKLSGERLINFEPFAK